MDASPTVAECQKSNIVTIFGLRKALETAKKEYEKEVYTGFGGQAYQAVHDGIKLFPHIANALSPELSVDKAAIEIMIAGHVDEGLEAYQQQLFNLAKAYVRVFRAEAILAYAIENHWKEKEEYLGEYRNS